MFDHEDIICALATGLQSSALSVIRVSGAGSLQCTEQIFSKKIAQADSHTLHFGHIKDGEKVIDEVLISVFQDGKSFTGEEMLEISCHASPYIVQQILKLLCQKGSRLAKPGEFSLRAFRNHKLDLAQAEAIPDLIKAETESEHKIALYQMRGGFSQDLKKLRERMIKFVALLELELDFVEEDVEFAKRDELRTFVEELRQNIGALISSFRMGNVIKDGIQVCIVGKPNVGKSTLLNALLNEEKAIVSDIPGTTRDTIEEQIIIEGIKFRFVDTAGIRQTEDKIESIGVQRALAKLQNSHINIFLFDASEEQSDFGKLHQTELNEENTLYVANKIDLTRETKALRTNKEILYISALNKTNLEELKQALLKKSKVESQSSNNTSLIITNLRHLQCLEEANSHLQTVLDGLSNQTSTELIAHDLYQAVHQLGNILGEVSNDDILDSVFRDFCIGK